MRVEGWGRRKRSDESDEREVCERQSMTTMYSPKEL